MESDGFTLCVRRKKKLSKKSPVILEKPHPEKWELLVSIRDSQDHIISFIENKRLELRNDVFYSKIEACFQTITDARPKLLSELEYVMCLGIGSLHSRVSQYQLALAILYGEHLGVSSNFQDHVKMSSSNLFRKLNG
jgi:hypothetical protein